VRTGAEGDATTERCIDNSASDPFIEMLSILAANRDPLFENYLGDRISKARRAVEGAAKSTSADTERLLKELDALLNLVNL
jgi:hypothetical protein